MSNNTESHKILINMFLIIIKYEKELEQLRIKLNQIDNFDLIKLFSEISSKNNIITKNDLLNFYFKNGFNIKITKNEFLSYLEKVIFFYNESKNKVLSYGEFLSLILSDTKYKLRRDIHHNSFNNNNNNNNYNNINNNLNQNKEICIIFNYIIQKEIELIYEIERLNKEFYKIKYFNIKKLFNELLIDGNFTPGSIIKIFDQFNIKNNDSDIRLIMKRFDINGDCEVNYDDFKTILTFGMNLNKFNFIRDEFKKNLKSTKNKNCSMNNIFEDLNNNINNNEKKPESNREFIKNMNSPNIDNYKNKKLKKIYDEIIDNTIINNNNYNNNNINENNNYNNNENNYNDGNKNKRHNSIGLRKNVIQKIFNFENENGFRKGLKKKVLNKNKSYDNILIKKNLIKDENIIKEENIIKDKLNIKNINIDLDNEEEDFNFITPKNQNNFLKNMNNNSDYKNFRDSSSNNKKTGAFNMNELNKINNEGNNINNKLANINFNNFQMINNNNDNNNNNNKIINNNENIQTFYKNNNSNIKHENNQNNNYYDNNNIYLKNNENYQLEDNFDNNIMNYNYKQQYFYKNDNFNNIDINNINNDNDKKQLEQNSSERSNPNNIQNFIENKNEDNININNNTNIKYLNPQISKPPKIKNKLIDMSLIITGFLKVVISMEYEIEQKKLIISQRNDFFIKNLFIIFESHTYPNKITISSFQKTLFKIFNLELNDIIIYLFFKRFDCNKKGFLNMEEFYDIFIPFEQRIRNQIIYNRNFINNNFNLEKNSEMKKLIKNLFETYFDFETQLNKMKYDMNVDENDIKNYFNKIDKNKKGYFLYSEMLDYLSKFLENTFENQIGSDLLFLRLDKKKEEKIDFDDLLNELKYF